MRGSQLIQGIDARRLGDAYRSLRSVILVAEQIVCFVGAKIRKQIRIGPVARRSDCGLPRVIVAWLTHHVAHGIQRTASSKTFRDQERARLAVKLLLWNRFVGILELSFNQQLLEASRHMNQHAAVGTASFQHENLCSAFRKFSGNQRSGRPRSHHNEIIHDQFLNCVSRWFATAFACVDWFVRYRPLSGTGAGPILIAATSSAVLRISCA